MISSLSKLADKSFIVGFVVPALLSILALTALFPNLPWFGSLATALTSTSSKLDDVALFVISVWVVAVLLSMTNTTQYRILEGYIGPSRGRATFYQQQFDGGRTKLGAVYDAWNAEQDPAAKETLASALSGIKRDLLATYPTKKTDVLPTRFGNVIRAFEAYPHDVYGIEPVVGWTRLSAVIPRDFQAQIGDARSHVDFLVNLLFGAVLIAVCALAKGLAVAAAGTVVRVEVALDLEVAVAALLVAYAAYRWAIDQVGAWGDLVKAAFDCYLPALAKQLGFTLPPDGTSRSALWVAFNQRIIYSDNAAINAWIAENPVPATPETKADPTKPASEKTAEPESEKANASDNDPADPAEPADEEADEEVA